MQWWRRRGPLRVAPSSPARSHWSRGLDRLAILAAGEARQLLEVVVSLDPTDRARAGAHDDRIGDRAVLREADAVEEGAVRHARGRDEDVVAADEVVGRQHALGVVARVDELRPLLVVSRPEPPLHRAAETLDGRRRDDALGRS